MSEDIFACKRCGRRHHPELACPGGVGPAPAAGPRHLDIGPTCLKANYASTPAHDEQQGSQFCRELEELMIRHRVYELQAIINPFEYERIHILGGSE